MHVWLESKGREIIQIAGDGFCFLKSIQYCLWVQYKEFFTIDQITEKIIEEMESNTAFYQNFVVAGQNAVAEVRKYFLTSFFASDIVDVVIGAACNTFLCTIWILQRNQDGIAHSIIYSAEKEEAQRKHIHLILYRDAGDDKGLGNHYNAIVSAKKNKGRTYSTEFEPEQMNNSPQPSPPLSVSGDEFNFSGLETDSVIDVSEEETEIESGPDTPPDISTPSENEETGEIEESILLDETDLNISQATTPVQEDFGPIFESTPPAPTTPNPSPTHVMDDFNPTMLDPTVVPDFSNEPDASVYNLREEEQKVNFPEDIFHEEHKEIVTQVPYNINGNHFYSIQLLSGNKWTKVTEDGRWFAMNTSTQRRSNKKRRIGKCMGSYICEHPDCPKFKSGKGKNTYAFTNIGFNLNECSICGVVAERKFCGALKLATFDPETLTVNVKYAGTHTCDLKVRTPYQSLPEKTKKSVLKPILQKNPKATSKVIAEEAAEKFIRIGQPHLARQAIKLASDRRLISEMKEEVFNMVNDKDPNSFRAVAELRKQMKDFDPFLIYKINDGSLNDGISYVFKSSTCAAKLALEMDCEDPNNISCLKDEPVYIDTMHSRVQNYKDITAWVKNPITRAVMRIATMEAQHEDTPTMIIFFRLLNEVLQKVSGIPDYKFNPSRFYVDEAGANKNAIKKVYGKKALKKTVTCQWHFLRNCRLKRSSVRVEHRRTFIKLCRRIIRATTKSKYEQLAAALRKICMKNKIMHFYNWWDERKYHIVPAFRGFNLSGLNLAESGQSGLKPKTHKKMNLIDAAYKDCASMMRQDEMYKAYIGNISKEIGKGLNIRQILERDRKAQENRAKEYAESLLTGDLQLDTDDEEGNTRPFLPTHAARHRPPKTFSRKNPTERKQRKKKKSEDRTDYNFDTDASSIHDDENETVPEFVDDDFVASVKATKLVFINNTIKRCYGCGEKFNHGKMVPPRNLVFSRKTRRLRPDGKGGQVKNRIATNAFFCARDMGCIEMEFPQVPKRHIYMGNVTFKGLTPGHKKYLKMKGYWDAIIANRKLKAAYN